MKVGDKVSGNCRGCEKGCEGGEFVAVIKATEKDDFFGDIELCDHEGWHTPHHCPSAQLTVIGSTRVPLAEVKTQEEAEAWIGETVEMAVNYACGIKEGDHLKIDKWNIEQQWFTGTHRNVKEVFIFPSSLRPLSQEPKAEELCMYAFTPGEGKPAKISADVFRIAEHRPIAPEGNACPHCRADSRCEDHTEGCPCKPVVEKAIDLLVTDRLARQAVLDDLAKRWQPHPLVLERIKRIRAENRRKDNE